jgi:hypothetical protein
MVNPSISGTMVDARAHVRITVLLCVFMARSTFFWSLG